MVLKARGKGKMMKRMRGGGLPSPEYHHSGGFFISTETMLFLLIVILVVGAFFIYAYKTQPSNNQILYRDYQVPQNKQTQVIVNGGDNRYSMAPKPERVYYNGPDLDYPRAAIPIGIPTRGLPDAYQTMGVLKDKDGKMTPLIGRRTAGSSDRYNYYTRTDTYNPLPIPLEHGKRNCQDDIGCKEIFSGDELRIGPTGEKVEATLYKMSNIFL